MDNHHDLYARLKALWESMLWRRIDENSSQPASADQGGNVSERSSRRDSTSSSSDCGVTIETESSSDGELQRIFMSCPLWSDLPENLVETLLECSTKPDEHFELLDAKLSTLLKVLVPLHDEAKPAPLTVAASILERVPESSTPMSNSLGLALKGFNAPGGYLDDRRRRTCRTPTWESYRVTTTLDSNTVRLALMIAHFDQMPSGLGLVMEGYVNLLSRLLDSIYMFGSHGSGLVPHPGPRDDQAHPEAQDQHHSSQVAQAFIWTAWQRALLLYAYYVLGVRLQSAVPSSAQVSELAKTSKDFEVDFKALGNSLCFNRDSEGSNCEYMCMSAFELLRTSVVSATQDFRTLFTRFGQQFGGRQPRCHKMNGVWERCNKETSFSCKRFFGLEIPDQSAHNLTCSGSCKRVLWNEASYRRVKGPRAVSCLSDSLNGPLEYCVATHQTLAISHVWSHGQGGNPEHGFNQCLHSRYSALAQDLNCTSYWIDAACIPSNPELRSAAIRTINPIFRNSNVTLIVDKDILEVDVTNPSVEVFEVVVAVLLLSDWNVRAWTMLEVIRGSKAVHLLCKHNKVLPLRQVLFTLYQEGTIDLCALLVGSPQLVPTGVQHRTPSIESAGVLLSRRYASRIGDDVIIWSLLIGDDMAHSSPEALWKSRVDTLVNTGFLMSSCARVQGAAGLGWAPATPQVLGQHGASFPLNSTIYWPYDGDGTIKARIMRVKDRGSVCLRGKWLVHVFSLQEATLARGQCGFFGSCWELAEELVVSEKYERVVFIRPILSESVESGIMAETSAPFKAAQNLDDSQDMAVAICATKENHAQYFDLADPENWTGQYELEPEFWEWKGVRCCPNGSAPNRLIDMIRYIRLV